MALGAVASEMDVGQAAVPELRRADGGLQVRTQQRYAPR